jgi:hypothetical protein
MTDRGDRDAPGSDDETGSSQAGDDEEADRNTLPQLPARDRIVERVVQFARDLRRHGADVPPDAAIVATRALVQTGVRDRDRVRAAMQASLITDHDDVAVFERRFPVFWYRLLGDDGTVGSDGADDTNAGRSGDDDNDRQDLTRTVSDRTSRTTNEDTSRPATRRTTAARAERDGKTGDDTESVTTYSPSGTANRVREARGKRSVGVDAAVSQIADALANRSGWRLDRSGTGAIDARRALRDGLDTGGTVVDLPERDYKSVTTGTTVLVDVSRSVLDALDRRFLLEFLHEMVSQWHDARVFFFDTDLEDVTEEFESGDVDATIAALESAETRWGGGTRIGHSIQLLRNRHPFAIDRKTAVFVVSDGLETGDVESIERGVAWLARRGRWVLWLNPLAGSPGYEPTSLGMAAAYPYIDGLFAFEDVSSLEELAEQLERRGPDGPLGYKYERRRSRGSGTE